MGHFWSVYAIETQAVVECSGAIGPQSDRAEIARGVLQNTLDKTPADSSSALIFHYVQVPHAANVRIVYVRVAAQAADAEQSLAAKCAEQDFPLAIESIDAAFPFRFQAGDHAEPLIDCLAFHRPQRGR